MEILSIFVQNLRNKANFNQISGMIREFWVENFYSIKERQTLNFEAKGNTDSFASVMVDDKVRLNKIAILYGANASGKSNILYALQTVFRLLITPKSTRNKKIVCYYPFALAKGEPTKMGLSFYVNGIRYDYEISYNEDYILSETLNFYPKGYKASFYTREFVAESSAANITFGTSAEIKKKAENTFVSNTLNNHTVLSTYAKVAFEEDITAVSDLFAWITKSMHGINEYHDPNETFADMMRKVDEDPKMKSFFLQMIKKADFNIVDFHYEDSVVLQSGEKTKDIMFTSVAGKDSFDLKTINQSGGTIAFLEKTRLLYDMVYGNNIFLFDEPENDLHYDLFLFYLNAFLYNSDKSQMIIASHLTSLLAEDLINEQRDLIYFVEKDFETATSSCKRADKYGLHKNQSLYNAYKIGKLGAKPALGSPFILNE